MTTFKNAASASSSSANSMKMLKHNKNVIYRAAYFGLMYLSLYTKTPSRAPCVVATGRLPLIGFERDTHESSFDCAAPGAAKTYTNNAEATAVNYPVSPPSPRRRHCRPAVEVSGCPRSFKWRVKSGSCHSRGRSGVRPVQSMRGRFHHSSRLPTERHLLTSVLFTITTVCTRISSDELNLYL